MRKNHESPIVCRMPAVLVKQLDSAAKRSKRTRSEEMRLRLEESLQRVPSVIATVTVAAAPSP